MSKSSLLSLSEVQSAAANDHKVLHCLYFMTVQLTVCVGLMTADANTNRIAAFEGHFPSEN